MEKKNQKEKNEQQQAENWKGIYTQEIMFLCVSHLFVSSAKRANADQTETPLAEYGVRRDKDTSLLVHRNRKCEGWMYILCHLFYLCVGVWVCVPVYPGFTKRKNKWERRNEWNIWCILILPWRIFLSYLFFAFLEGNEKICSKLGEIGVKWPTFVRAYLQCFFGKWGGHRDWLLDYKDCS